jgi:hypothetical protein
VIGGGVPRGLRGAPGGLPPADRRGSMRSRASGISAALGEDRSMVVDLCGFLMGLGRAPVSLDGSSERSLRGPRGLIYPRGRRKRQIVAAPRRDQFRLASGGGIASLVRVLRS